MSSSIEQHLPTTLGSVELEARLTTSCSDTSYCSACDFFAIAAESVARFSVDCNRYQSVAPAGAARH